MVPRHDPVKHPPGETDLPSAPEATRTISPALDANSWAPQAEIETPMPLGQAATAESLPSRGGEPIGSAYEILVAEDHPINLKLVVALLQAAGCRFLCAGNGAEALAAFENAGFDLVVMDSQMPVMTGIEAIAAIRGRRDWKRLMPILSLTAHAMKGAEEYHTSAGADVYMSKPLQAGRFIDAVKRLARRGRDLRRQNCGGGTVPAS